MKKVVLFDQKSDRINTNVFASIEDNGDLRIDGCDAGPLVKRLWGDYDYEYIITVKQSDLPRLCSALGTNETKLLASIAKSYSGEKAFSRFKKFLENQDIPFDFFTWA